jgi:hypothetical protein
MKEMSLIGATALAVVLSFASITPSAEQHTDHGAAGGPERMQMMMKGIASINDREEASQLKIVWKCSALRARLGRLLRQLREMSRSGA